MMETPNKMNYLKCPKAGLHSEESLNLVCLEKSCLQNLLCCCACLEYDHKQHKSKPIKMVLADARNQAHHFSTQNINLDIILDIAQTHKQESIKLFHDYKRGIMENLDQIQSSLQSYFSLTIDQILLHNSNNNLIVEEAIERAYSPKNLEELKITVRKIVALLGEDNKGNMTEDQLKQSLLEASKSIQRSISTSLEEVSNKLNSYHSNITTLVNNTNIWQKIYKFSPTLKHKDVALMSDFSVKATNGSGYKFALMEPGIGKAPLKSFTLKIKQSSSNWLGVGFCYRNIALKNKFTFTFGSLKQGAYLISSNGGSWSHSHSQYNNNLKGFKFNKDDIIAVTVDQQAKSIEFQKDTMKYSMPYEIEPQDELHPCVLFYYLNDEVEVPTK